MSVKFLGVILDSSLSWNDHINNLTRKIAKFVPIFYRIRSLCTVESLKIIYNGLVYSNLVYCSSIWGFNNQVTLKPLITMQKKIIRAIAGLNCLDHTSDYFKKNRFLM